MMTLGCLLQIAKILPRQRLLMILGEYQEYPSHYRQIIWSNLLKLPNNTLAYCNLLEKCAHKLTQPRRRKIYPFDSRLDKNLQRIIAYLTTWSRILSISFDLEDHFLPEFVYPFVKCNSNNLLMCFEMIATILLNQCSMWFEFSPMLPINYLGLIENLIDHYKPSLIAFYRRHSIDSSVYAWKMLRTAFYEILEEFQWLQLWDHILSAPSWFMVFIVVAFNCVQHMAIGRSNNPTEIQHFFDEPSGINVKVWIQCAYKQMNQCPEHLHPKQYMPEFKCLDVDRQYRRISNYPQHIFNKQIQRKNEIALHVQSINRKYMDLEKFEVELMQQMVNTVRVDEHHRRMQKIELSHELAARNQFNRLEYQRQQLILAERQLNDREALMQLITAENERLNGINRREIDLHQILCDFNKRVRLFRV